MFVSKGAGRVSNDPLTKILAWAVAASLVACVVLAVFLIACYGGTSVEWF
jgi:hypothetical protein